MKGMQKAICVKCAKEIIVSVTQEEAGQDLKGLDMINGSRILDTNTYYCYECSRKASEERERINVPKLAKKLLKEIHAIYRCPVCENETTTKDSMLHHITTMHDTWHIEQALGIKHKF